MPTQMHPPSVPALHAGPWHVICLAAVSAIDFGRSALHRLTRLSPPPTPPRNDPYLFLLALIAFLGQFVE